MWYDDIGKAKSSVWVLVLQVLARGEALVSQALFGAHPTAGMALAGRIQFGEHVMTHARCPRWQCP